MGFKNFSPIACAAAAMLCSVALPLQASAQTVLEGSGEVSTIDCDGGAAQITGTNNKVTVEGACKLVTVEGSGNVVIAQMAAQSSIKVVGTSNMINWTAPGQSRPKVSSTGVGNSINRAR